MKQVNILASLFLIGGLFLVVGTQLVNAQWSNDTSMGNSTNSTTNANATNATSPISTTDEDGVGGIAGIRIGDGG